MSPGVSTTRLLPGFSSDDGLESVDHAVLELQGLDQIGVPDHATIVNLDVGQLLVDNVHLVNAFFQNLKWKKRKLFNLNFEMKITTNLSQVQAQYSKQK
jgi:hypothetical protein